MSLETSARKEADLLEEEELPSTEIAKERSCLRCSTRFRSAWAGERICPRCKQSSAWRAGTPFESISGGKR